MSKLQLPDAVHACSHICIIIYNKLTAANETPIMMIYYTYTGVIYYYRVHHGAAARFKHACHHPIIYPFLWGLIMSRGLLFPFLGAHRYYRPGQRRNILLGFICIYNMYYMHAMLPSLHERTTWPKLYIFLRRFNHSL